MRQTIFLMILTSVLVGCSSIHKQKIQYKTNDLPVVSSVIPISVCVKEFADIRRDYGENWILFEKDKKARKDERPICINSEKYYNEGTVSKQISSMLVDHLNEVGLFGKTTLNDDSQTDYYLTGKLVSFSAMQLMGRGNNLELERAISVRELKTSAEIKIEIKDMVLLDKSGKVIKEIGGYSQVFSEDMEMDEFCWCIFKNVNEKLKEFNQGVIAKLEEELRTLK
jgi:hypothetical protein